VAAEAVPFTLAPFFNAFFGRRSRSRWLRFLFLNVFLMFFLQAVPFSLDKQLLLIQAYQDVMVANLGPALLFGYKEELPGFLDNYETTPFVDM
jgi:hypothetical protein